MVRIFLSLAALTLLSIFSAIGVGFWSFFLPRSTEQNEVFIGHFFLGLMTAIFILLVHCLIFIYFLGTGRWVKEVTLAYKMPDEPHHKRTRELKRSTYPVALIAMLIGIVTAAAGAGAQLQAWPWYVHMTLAFLTLFVNIWTFRIEYRNVVENSALIEAVLVEVDRIRLAHGLNSNEEALREDYERMAPESSPAIRKMR